MKTIDVLGSKIHYVEQGHGDPILFLHGMPTSSYLWRNIIPYISTLGRCIAPDLIGMGKSDRPDIAYTIADHIRYVEKFIEALNLRKVTLVLHGWGSVIGLDYAMRNEANCKGLVFYESYLRPFTGESVSLPYQEQVKALQDQIIKNDLSNFFVNIILQQRMLQPFPDSALSQYREPLLRAGSEKLLLQYIHDLPLGHGNSTTDQLIASYSDKLTRSKLPKLMPYSIPGFITTMATVMWAKENLPNIELVEIGEELHYAQESYPDIMGETISVWLQGIESIRY